MRNGTGRARTSTRSSPAPSRPRERWETARLLDARIAIRWTTSPRVAHSAARRCSGTSPAWGSDGCARSRERRRWTVYDLSPGVIARARSLDGGLGARVRYLPTDLNFVRLPDAAYDVIWTTDTLHCITNLEHVVTQIEQALRPGGLFALCGYVGEERMQFDPRRLERINAVLASLPEGFRLTDAMHAPEASLELSPFMAVRAPDVLPLVRARFDVVHEAVGGRLFPLPLTIDWDAAARQGAVSDLVARLEAAEAAAASDPVMRPCVAYGVYRPRRDVIQARPRSAPG